MKSKKEAYRNATKALHIVGMTANNNGYRYVRDAIVMVYMDRSYIKSMSKRLYPEIAGKYGASATSVSKAIDNAIKSTWTRGSSEVLTEMFANTVSYRRTKPSNAEFIAMIADYLAIEDIED